MPDPASLDECGTQQAKTDQALTVLHDLHPVTTLVPAKRKEQNTDWTELFDPGAFTCLAQAPSCGRCDGCFQPDVAGWRKAAQASTHAN